MSIKLPIYSSYKINGEINFMEDTKLLSGQRYFISKIVEYFEPKPSYIFTKILQDKRYDSISLLLEEFLEINRDIKEGNGDKTRLKNSLHSSLKCILFHFKQNPLLKKGTLSRDIRYLIKKIDNYFENENDFSLNTISLSISSLYKRYNSKNLIGEYIDFITKTPLSYREIDLLVEYFVSELINLEYSFKYLNEWKKEHKLFKENIKNFDTSTINNILSSFKELIKETIKYTILLNSWLPDVLKNELDSEECIRINYKYQKPNEEEIQVILKKDMNFPQSDQYLNLKVDVYANDKYKAIEKIVKNLENYLEMYKKYYDYNKMAVNVKCLLSIETGEWIMVRSDNTDTQIFSKSLSARENEDIKDFLLLRDDVRKENGNITTSIKQLNNAFDMLNKSINATPENRLLNNWSSLEYILNAYEGPSIISKIIDIVPKVISLYFIKDRFNLLWDKISSNKTLEEIEQVKKLKSSCARENGKYDKNKLIEYLADESNIKGLYESLEENVVIHREIALINEMLNNKSKRLDYIEQIKESIEHDLTRIYRVRNKLVHSHNSISYNVDILTIRLNKYVNSLIGTIIHYLKRNPNLEILEVLNSIHETYEWYKIYLKDGQDLKKIAFPPYLYL